MTTSLTHALNYHELKLACVPAHHGTKTPAVKWTQYQDVGPTGEQLTQMFQNHPRNIAILCGRPSGNLLAIDCDTPQAYKETAARLEGVGINTPTIRRPPNGSPHDGGGTFLLRAPKLVGPRKLDGIDLLGHGRIVLAPPSWHPGGTQYYFSNGEPNNIYKLPSLNALEWLDLEPPRPDTGESTIPSIPRDIVVRNPGGLAELHVPNEGKIRYIPWQAWKILIGDETTLMKFYLPDIGRIDRSHAESEACAYLRWAGFSFGDALYLFTELPAAGKFAGRYEYDPRQGISYLKSQWDNTVDYIDKPSVKAAMLACSLREWAHSRPWSARSGATDLAVYLAHLEIVIRCRKQPHGASARELAELANVCYRTASQANKRLIEKGLLTLSVHATGENSNEYELLTPADLCVPCDNISLDTGRKTFGTPDQAASSHHQHLNTPTCHTTCNSIYNTVTNNQYLRQL